MNTDEIFISRCIELAPRGMASTAPNPMVGSVIVCDNKIIGEGFHQFFGGNHAEVNAVNSVRDKNLLEKSTLYVSLEPCSHQGKTPPCADFIISNKIPEVVVATADPNKLVAGNGIRKLQNAGIKVRCGILEKEARKQNCRFFTFHEKNRPYIILKWAQSSDGFIDTFRKPGSNEKPVWITDETMRMLVHKWRSEEQAILVGKNTARLDNPQLNVREWNGKNPLRLVLDQKLELPSHLKLFTDYLKTIVFTAMTKPSGSTCEYITLDYTKNILSQMMDFLHGRHILSVLVEGGFMLLQSFIDAGLWDEARVFTGPVNFGRGVSAPAISLQPAEEKHFGNQQLKIYFR